MVTAGLFSTNPTKGHTGDNGNADNGNADVSWGMGSDSAAHREGVSSCGIADMDSAPDATGPSIGSEPCTALPPKPMLRRSYSAGISMLGPRPHRGPEAAPAWKSSRDLLKDKKSLSALQETAESLSTSPSFAADFMKSAEHASQRRVSILDDLTGSDRGSNDGYSQSRKSSMCSVTSVISVSSLVGREYSAMIADWVDGNDEDLQFQFQDASGNDFKSAALRPHDIQGDDSDSTEQSQSGTREHDAIHTNSSSPCGTPHQDDCDPLAESLQR